MFDRTTIVSSNVYDILQTTQNPLSVQMIINQLKKKSLHPNKATIYRILKKLKDKNAITEFTARNGASFYEISGQHHHHFICNHCDTAYCLSGCHMETKHISISDLLPNNNFKPESHDFNIYGICEPCSLNT
jgi:Fur family ferric uptake transcriptional regulator